LPLDDPAKPARIPASVRRRCEHVFVLRADEVLELSQEGRTQKEIAHRLGISPPSVCYHMRQLGIAPQQQRRQDWSAVRAFYEEGHSWRECQERFGFSRAAWYQAVHRKAIVPRPAAMPIERLLAGPRNGTHLKSRLLAAGLKENHCERCGLTAWRGEPLCMAIHHVNGERKDNRLENLRLLCPNCHSQTANFAGRNRGRVAVARRPRAQFLTPPGIPPAARIDPPPTP